MLALLSIPHALFFGRLAIITWSHSSTTLGNAFHMPEVKQWETFAKWADRYGVLSLSALHTLPTALDADDRVGYAYLHRRAPSDHSVITRARPWISGQQSRSIH